MTPTRSTISVDGLVRSSTSIREAASAQSAAVDEARRAGTKVAGVESASCINCHETQHDPHGSMQATCVHCHGGDGSKETKEEAHPDAKFPARWPEGGGNPERPYTLTLEETAEWVRFVNPGDYRVAHETCAPCHAEITDAALKSVMATAGHFWGVATYANGIVSTKRSILGSSYGPDGNAQGILQMIQDPDGTWRAPTDEEMAKHSFAPLAPAAAALGGDPARQRLPRLRTGQPPRQRRPGIQRTQHADPRAPRQVRGSGPTEQPALGPWPRHAQPRRPADAQRPQDPPQRPAHGSDGHQRPAR